MIFYHIPKDRCINLDVTELQTRGYKIPSELAFKCAMGASPFFKLVEAGVEYEEIFGPAKLTMDGKLYIPEALRVYTQYCVMYDDTCVHIALGK